MRILIPELKSDDYRQAVTAVFPDTKVYIFRVVWKYFLKNSSAT